MRGLTKHILQMSINGLFCDDSDRKFTKTWGILRGGAEQKKPEEGFI